MGCVMVSVDVERRIDPLDNLYYMLRARAEVLGLDVSLSKIIRQARDVLSRVENIEYGTRYVRATILSSIASRGRPEHTVVVRGLDGRVRKVRVGVPLEQSYHNVIVSSRVLKCDCPVALRIASRADAFLESIAKRYRYRIREPMLFSKHILCKHTVAILAKAMDEGIIVMDDELIDNLSLALIGLQIYEKGTLPRPAYDYLSRVAFEKSMRYRKKRHRI